MEVVDVAGNAGHEMVDQVAGGVVSAGRLVADAAGDIDVQPKRHIVLYASRAGCQEGVGGIRRRTEAWWRPHQRH